MKYTTNGFLLMLSILLLSCGKAENKYDATGTFEADEIIISSEANGKIKKFEFEEGQKIDKGITVVEIDDRNLQLQKEQILSKIEAIDQKLINANPQLIVLKEKLTTANSQLVSLETQLSVLLKERDRIEGLFASGAATEQQRDELDGRVQVLQKQIETAASQKGVLHAQMKSAKQTVALQNRGINAEKGPLDKQLLILEDQISKTQVKNPQNGVLLSKYAKAGEMTGIGKPLYKLADLSRMTLKAYISGDQLSKTKIGQKVQVFVDDAENNYREYEGAISAIAHKAEFTPKTIQTKNERANLVYAIEVDVKNDGLIKIGMYGEVNMQENTSHEEQH